MQSVAAAVAPNEIAILLDLLVFNQHRSTCRDASDAHGHTSPVHHSSMSHLSAEVKHHILLEYSPHSPTHSFAALAARHGVSGGARTVQRWHQRWDHMLLSLERREGSGKERSLSRAQVSRHVCAPILAANRAHRAVHYTDLLPAVRQKTGKQVSIQTLCRYGTKDLGAKQKHTKKRTTDENNIEQIMNDAWEKMEPGSTTSIAASHAVRTYTSIVPHLLSTGMAEAC